nr:permease [Clostridium sp. Cult3]
MGELILLFIGISFFVALIQIYLSKDKIKRILTTPRKGLNSVLGAILGAVTPFCSCSTVPILVGLLKSGAPFSGTISFLLTSPILNPAIIALFLTFFGMKATIIYSAFTFVFAVIAGLFLDKLGFEREVKNVSIKGDNSDELVYEDIEGTFLEKNKIAFKHGFLEALVLFRQVFPYLLLGAGIGSFIYEFVPQDLLSNFAGKSNILSVPIAAIIGIPMYIRTETMIPIARILIDKGVGYGTMVALIIGGAGASIPELSLLGSIFKKKMMIAFVLSIFTVAIITGYVFNIIM